MRLIEDTVFTFIIQQQLIEKLNIKVTRFDYTNKRLIACIKRVSELIARETVRHLRGHSYIGTRIGTRSQPLQCCFELGILLGILSGFA